MKRTRSFSLFGAAFRQRRLGLLTRLIVAALIYLACLTTMAEGALTHALAGWGQDLGARLTVQLAPSSIETEAQRAERVRALTAALMDMPELDQVTLVSDEETLRLLQPWIADEALLKTLPLPTLIDVRVKTGRHLDPGALAERIASFGEGMKVDGPGEWLASVRHMIKGVQAVVGALIALTLGVLVVAVALIGRAVLASQRETIDLLHLLGATDRTLANAFQAEILRLTAPAALLGAALAGATAWGLMALFHKVGRVGWAAWVSTSAGGVWALVVPVLAVALIVLFARVFVLRALRGAS
jgi:cell division transport system permease protein